MVKPLLAKIFARYIYSKNQKWINKPMETQQKTLLHLVHQAKNTAFGKEHHFEKIKNHEDFACSVTVNTYENLEPYINQIREGKPDVLWQGLPIYFAKTSGTTSGAKYIPITKESIKYHISAARDAILHYIHQTGNAKVINGKMIFLQGSPILKKENNISIGRLSGIVAHYVPKYLQSNRMPSWETNCIDDWETKVDAIVGETLPMDMSIISGIPSWVQMYFEKLIEKSDKKNIQEIFKNFSLFIYGGVNYDPYRSKFEQMIGSKIDSIELFPASEGFFAFQDQQEDRGMLLLLNSNIFYEFIDVKDLDNENPKAITIKDVKLGVNYLLIISTNAGLWRYNIGDTVIFTSLKPYRVIVSGRIKHFISAFGEHVIAKEVEQSMKNATVDTPITISEFTVAPQVNPPIDGELPYHEWFVEFEKMPENIQEFSLKIDTLLQEQNIYYKDLIQGKILQPLKIRAVKKGSFNDYMETIGKLGGQNKIQRLANDRKIADHPVFASQIKG